MWYLKKRLLLIVTLVGMSQITSAVDFNIIDADYKRDEIKIRAFADFLKEDSQFTANNAKDLEKNIKNDWVFAQKLYSEGLSDYNIAWLTNMLNREMSRMYVKKIQDGINLKDDIVKSYYLDHISDYKIQPIADLTVFRSKSLESISKFYNFTQTNDINKSKIEAEKVGIEVLPYRARLNRMYPGYREAIKARGMEIGYYTYPQYIKGYFVVSYINNMELDIKYIPFEHVQKQIKAQLTKKTFRETKEKLLDDAGTKASMP